MATPAIERYDTAMSTPVTANRSIYGTPDSGTPYYTPKTTGRRSRTSDPDTLRRIQDTVDNIDESIAQTLATVAERREARKERVARLRESHAGTRSVPVSRRKLRSGSRDGVSTRAVSGSSRPASAVSSVGNGRGRPLPRVSINHPDPLAYRKARVVPAATDDHVKFLELAKSEHEYLKDQFDEILRRRSVADKAKALKIQSAEAERKAKAAAQALRLAEEREQAEKDAAARQIAQLQAKLAKTRKEASDQAKMLALEAEAEKKARLAEEKQRALRQRDAEAAREREESLREMAKLESKLAAQQAEAKLQADAVEHQKASHQAHLQTAEVERLLAEKEASKRAEMEEMNRMISKLNAKLAETETERANVEHSFQAGTAASVAEQEAEKRLLLLQEREAQAQRERDKATLQVAQLEAKIAAAENDRKNLEEERESNAAYAKAERKAAEAEAKLKRQQQADEQEQAEHRHQIAELEKRLAAIKNAAMKKQDEVHSAIRNRANATAAANEKANEAAALLKKQQALARSRREEAAQELAALQAAVDDSERAARDAGTDEQAREHEVAANAARADIVTAAATLDARREIEARRDAAVSRDADLTDTINELVAKKEEARTVAQADLAAKQLNDARRQQQEHRDAALSATAVKPADAPDADAMRRSKQNLQNLTALPVCEHFTPKIPDKHVMLVFPPLPSVDLTLADDMKRRYCNVDELMHVISKYLEDQESQSKELANLGSKITELKASGGVNQVHMDDLRAALQIHLFEHRKHDWELVQVMRRLVDPDTSGIIESTITADDTARAQLLTMTDFMILDEDTRDRLDDLVETDIKTAQQEVDHLKSIDDARAINDPEERLSYEQMALLQISNENPSVQLCHFLDVSVPEGDDGHRHAPPTSPLRDTNDMMNVEAEVSGQRAQDAVDWKQTKRELKNARLFCEKYFPESSASYEGLHFVALPTVALENVKSQGYSGGDALEEALHHHLAEHHEDTEMLFDLQHQIEANGADEAKIKDLFEQIAVLLFNHRQHDREVLRVMQRIVDAPVTEVVDVTITHDDESIVHLLTQLDFMILEDYERKRLEKLVDDDMGGNMAQRAIEDAQKRDARRYKSDRVERLLFEQLALETIASENPTIQLLSYLDSASSVHS